MTLVYPNSVFDFLDDFADVMRVFDGEEGLYEAESGIYDLIFTGPHASLKRTVSMS